MIKRFCSKRGCNNLVDVGLRYCAVHASEESVKEQERQKQYDSKVRLTRDAEYHNFYLSGDWGRAKDAVHAKYKGLCLWSYYKEHEIVSLEEVHHIEPLRLAWEKRLLLDNLFPLTHAIHMMVEAEYRKGGMAALQAELRSLLRRWDDEFGGGRGM